MKKDFCFCTLAISPRYCLLAKELAMDLERYASGTILVVYTDLPNEFKDCNNVLFFKHYQKGIHSCVNDKRFAIEKSLSMFNTAIFLDADTRIVSPIPENMSIPSGITTRHKSLSRSILECRVNRENKYRAEITTKIADKLDIDLKVATLIPSNMFAVSKEEGKEFEFIEIWDKIARYFELKNIHYADENAIGLAAAKVRLTVTSSNNLEELAKVRKHLFVTSHSTKSKKILERLKRWSGIPYRLSRSLLIALRDFEFYFR